MRALRNPSARVHLMLINFTGEGLPWSTVSEAGAVMVECDPRHVKYTVYCILNRSVFASAIDVRGCLAQRRHLNAVSLGGTHC